ncbi:MAG: hypothetical protein JXA82_02725 [Sedimentisphaerales bacterium]|nr:hypothetical protein [Sedimentisphaerales bacterium]
MNQVVNLTDLTIERIKQALEEVHCLEIRNPGGELFQHEDGFRLDLKSLLVLSRAYDALGSEARDRFNSTLQDEHRLAGLLEKMWADSE